MTNYAALIASDRVSARTRAVLNARAAPSDQGGALAPAALVTLRAALARILPQTALDLATPLDGALAAGEGDGWRFDDLPPDREAYTAGLAALDAAAHAQHGQAFAALAGDAQDAILTDIAAGPLSHWFEDLCGDAVKIYVAHPSTLARIFYSGIAYGGDGPHKQGFHALEPGAREEWEPVAEPAP